MCGYVFLTLHTMFMQREMLSWLLVVTCLLNRLLTAQSDEPLRTHALALELTCTSVNIGLDQRLTPTMSVP